MSTLKEQAKKIAEKYPNLSWARPGMACRSESDHLFRYVSLWSWGYRDGEYTELWVDNKGTVYRISIDEAKRLFCALTSDAGPDLRDTTTVLSLLTLLPYKGGVIYDYDAAGGGWRHTYTLKDGSHGMGPVCLTMTEAIVGAVLGAK